MRTIWRLGRLHGFMGNHIPSDMAHGHRQSCIPGKGGVVHEPAVAMAWATAVESLDEACAMAEAKACEKPGADEA